MENTEEIENQLSDDEQNTPLIKTKKSVGRPKNPPKIKEKKPRTAKQIEAFAKVVEKNKEYKAKKLEEKKIESAKLLLANGIELPSHSADSRETIKKPMKLPPAKKLEEPEPVPEEEVENEIIYVKQPRKTEPKPKKKRKIIVYQDESSEDESSEEEHEVHIKSKKFKTQQNKKSLIKVGEKKPPAVEIVQHRNFFCD
jgi:hypothetical protein